MNETLIDLSVDIYQKCPTLPNHPPMVLSDYQTHKTIREAEGVEVLDIFDKYLQINQLKFHSICSPLEIAIKL